MWVRIPLGVLTIIMHYIVQENTFREENYNNLILSLDRLNLSYEIVKVLPFIETFDFNTKTKNNFVFGSLKLARLSNKLEWYPGSFMSDTDDFEIYKEHYKDNLLNYDSLIYNFSDVLIWDTEYKFIRPCKDTKVFTGKVYTKESWLEFVDYSLTNGHSTILSVDTKIQVSTPKNIQQEIRCWVVKGKVITASHYKIGRQVLYKEYIDNEGLLFAQKMVDIYQLADAFVIDICLVDNEWKIVECGCINCAGFYKADLQKLLMSLEDNFNN